MDASSSTTVTMPPLRVVLTINTTSEFTALAPVVGAARNTFVIALASVASFVIERDKIAQRLHLAQYHHA